MSNTPKKSCLATAESLFKSIDEKDPIFHAFITVDKENTLREAEQLDRLPEHEKAKLPLFGFPCVITDTLDMKGLPTSFGSKLLLGSAQNANEQEIDQLKKAGTLILGKTSLSEFGLLHETKNFISGSCVNPLNPSYSAGGGVAGNAVAIAAGFAEAGLTTDYLGGMRLSASFCGLPSLLPTRGLMPTVRKHLIPFSETMFYRKGIIAKNYSDLAKITDLLGQADPEDPITLISPHENLSESIRTSQKKCFRIGYTDSLGFISADPEVSQTVKENAQKWKKRGHNVEKIDLTLSIDLLLHFQNIYAADRYIVIMKYLREHHYEPSSLHPTTREWLKIGDKVSGVQYSLAISYLNLLEKILKRAFDNYDFLLLPVSPVSPYKTNETPKLIEYAQLHPYLILCGFLAPFNMSGHPVLTFVAGESSEGLPIGLQLVGPPFSESQLLHLGCQQSILD